MNDNERRLILSGKITKMGDALIIEGGKTNSTAIIQCGAIMILLAGMLLSDEDMFMLSYFCSSISAKKIMDSMDGIGDAEVKIIKEMIEKNKQLRGESLKPIKRVRKTKRNPPKSDSNESN